MGYSAEFATSRTTINGIIYYTITQDIINNTSTITLRFKVRRTNTGYTSYDYTNSAYLYLTCNGSTQSQQANFSCGPDTGWYDVGVTKTFVVSHNSDGTKTVNVSLNYTGSVVMTATTSFNITLPTIPRASQPSVSLSSVRMGEQVVINTNRVSNDFTHKIQYVFEGVSATIGEDIEESVSFTPPLSLAYQIPGSQSAVATIYCYTYSGSTLIGTKTCQLTVQIDIDMTPSMNVVITDELWI